MQIEWIFPQINQANGEIIGANWYCLATDGGVGAADFGSFVFGEPNPAANILADNITQNMLREWASTRLDMASIEAALSDKFANYTPP